jgi:Arm DNA-binding domain
MTKPTKDSRITNATVEAAKRDADAELDWQHPDPECKGLSLRVRGRGVSWTFRGPRLAGQNRRWTLGDHRVSPKEARRRAWAVRGRIQQGLDPTSLVTALVTGVDEQQQLDLRVEVRPSWEWSDAIDRFLTDIIGTTRQATRDDYRGTLKNTPELQVFCGRQVCDIVREEIAEAVEKVRKRGVKTHHKKVLVVTRCFFNWLGSDARRRYTSVAENFLLGAKAGAAERDVPGRRVVNKGIPDALPIGRSLAIARSGVLGALPSLGIQTVLGTVSRRRGVVGMRSQDYEPYRPGIYVWFQPAAFRKTADKIQSVAAHQVPLVGWAAGVVDILERRLRSDDTARWLFPVARPRHAGTAPKTPHMNVGTLNHNMDAMPGVYGHLSPHRLRVAFSSYGKKFGGFADGEAKMILDHTEGVGDDVTRGHYDLDPRIERKIEMMTWWVNWLDEQCAAAIAADPMLLDKDALRKACYIERYGQERWDAKIAKSKEGAPLWPADEQEERSLLAAE